MVYARIAQMVTNAVRLVRFQQSLRKYNSYRFESCPDYNLRVHLPYMSCGLLGKCFNGGSERRANSQVAELVDAP